MGKDHADPCERTVTDMNSSSFADKLKEITGCMSGEEIRDAIDRLNSYRTSAFRKNSIDKGMAAQIVSEAMDEAELYFRYRGAVRKLKTTGASVLTKEVFEELKRFIPVIDGPWWLHNGQAVLENRSRIDDRPTANIRPVLCISDLSGSGLRIGDIFMINGEYLKLISERIAIRTDCLQGFCSFRSDYDDSLVRLCVEGWYGKLVRDNRKFKPWRRD